MLDDTSRPAATSDDNTDYTLTIEEVAERYAHAGHPRTIRTLQRYCASGHLDSRRKETPFGERYMITPSSVARHLAYVEEVQPVAAGHDKPRHDKAAEYAQNMQDRSRIDVRPVTTSLDLSRQVADENVQAIPISSARQEATTSDTSHHDATESRYIDRLEGEVDFLRGEIATKNAQIKELTERSRETNLLIGGLQRMLAPLLGQPDPYPPSTDDQRPN